MLIGYPRASTRDQNAHLQLDTLRDAGCEKIFEETASAARRDRPELNAALDFKRSGDTLVAWKLNRLARLRGRKGGRPRSLSDKDLKQARALLTDPEITVEEVARRFGVVPSTLYRYLPAARQTAQDEA